VLGNGALLVVPVLPPEGQAPAQAVVLRFAARGRRLFSRDDARLAERVLDQLRRAVAFDTAVQRGRAEERTRLAQDLHDDIGARLLTLMYQAQTPEMEDYIRQTIKDLKTLSRGLAAGEVRLSHAAAEWKADLTRRCEAARVRLDWQLECDHDPLLSVVAWSALTRVLRELTTNVLAHAGATVLRVQLVLAGKRLRLAVVDDGEGRDPQGWSHGLGLAGVRKRVKQLGGEVRWVQREPRGIACELSVPEVTDRG
jgi:signal transduction histidine kinase